MLKLVGKNSRRTGYLPSLKISPYKILLNYKGKKSNFTVEKQETLPQPSDQGQHQQS